MSCWKSFNIAKNLGSLKLTIFSLLGMIGFFVIFNLLFATEEAHSGITGENIFAFIVLMILILPIHKLLHGAPIWLVGRKADLSLEWTVPLPSMYCNIKDPISKNLAITSLLCPALIITALMIFLAFMFPGQKSEFALIGAINFSLCVFDIVYLIHLFPAPAHSFVEDGRDGCRILIKQTIENKAFH